MNDFLKDKGQIEYWLTQNNIHSFELIEDEKYGFKINTSLYVNLSKKKFKFIPVKFNKVDANFTCAHNELTSLEFAPQEITGHFWCYDNKLQSLKGAPQVVGGDFSCFSNDLSNADHLPNKVGGHCFLGNNDFYPQLAYIRNLSDIKKALSLLNFNKKLSFELYKKAPAKKIKI